MKQPHRATGAFLSVGWRVLFALFASPLPGHAATFSVGTLSDKDNLLPPYSLRDAVRLANASPGEDTVMLGAGTYVLSRVGAWEDACLSGDIDVSGDLVIVGAGRDVTIIDAGGMDRVLHVVAGTVTCSDLTLRGGRIPGPGGGIYNAGHLTLTNVTVAECVASSGGGVFNAGTASLTLLDTRIEENAVAQAGGAVLSVGDSMVERTALLRNEAAVGGGAAFGGTAVSLASTVASNVAALRPVAPEGVAYTGSDSFVLSVPVGFTAVANNLDHFVGSTRDNHLSALLGSVPDGTIVYWWAVGTWQVAFYDSLEGWSADPVFEPGQAFWLRSGAAFSAVLTGQKRLSPLPIPRGTSCFVGSQVFPESAAGVGFEEALGLRPLPGDLVYLYDSTMPGGPSTNSPSSVHAYSSTGWDIVPRFGRAKAAFVSLAPASNSSSYTLTLQTGMRPVANHLDHYTGGVVDNRLSTLFASAPDGTALYFYDRWAGAYQVITKDFGVWGEDRILEPGQGVWISSPSGWSVVFTGLERVGPQAKARVPGLWFVSSQTLPAVWPGGATFEEAMGFAPVPGDVVTLYNNGDNTPSATCTYGPNGWDIVPLLGRGCPAFVNLVSPPGSYGGGIAALGSTLEVRRSTLHANASSSVGGAIHAALPASGSMLLENVTVSGNSATAGAGGLLATNASSTVVIRSSTFSSNAAPAASSILNAGASVSVQNTVLAYPSGGGANVIGSVSSLGYNLSSDATGPSSGTDLLNTDPQLGPLQDNGGSTWTHALTLGSPATDRGSSAGVATDQRGSLRPSDMVSLPNASGGDGSDIGAFELLNQPPTLTTVNTLSGAVEDSDFTLDFLVLAAAADESDPEGDPVSFRVESVTSGSLTKGGFAVTPGVTLLGPGEAFVWRPAADENGLVPAFAVRAWDGMVASIGAAVPVMFDVLSVNDAPSLQTSASPVCDSVTENAGAPVGAVGTLVGTLVDLVGPLYNVQDPDAGAMTGIAVVGADAAVGTWHYSIDGGSSWIPLGLPSNAAARLLASDVSTRIYFQPIPEFSGNLPSAITFRAWDLTQGVNGGVADTTVAGGSSAFSLATDVAALEVQAVNDPPSFDAIPSTWVILEDAGPQHLILDGIEAGGLEDQELVVVASSDNPALIPNPAVTYATPDTTGLVTYTVAPDQFGTATLQVAVRDAGLDGVSGNADDLSVTQGMVVSVLPVNDSPSYLAGPDLAVDAGASEDAIQTTWASAISAGPLENDVLDFLVQTDFPELFAEPPSINPGTGEIRFRRAPEAHGVADVTVTLRDNGGTANGGQDESPASTFKIGVGFPDNDNWPRAGTLVLQGGQRTVRQSIDLPDQARWYKLEVSPESRLIVTLENVPADYDLFVFGDIGRAYEELLVGDKTTEDLAKLGAEFAPTAFSPTAFSDNMYSPTAFSPTAFSPTAFSPTAFSPTAFSPTAFSPTAFSPTAFSPTAFSPTAFSPTAFSPTAFSPTAFSPTAFSPTAFSGAQTRSLMAVSAFDGTAPEGVMLNTWDNDGSVYICVHGRGGAHQRHGFFELRVTVVSGACEEVEAIAMPFFDPGPLAIPPKLLVVMDSARMAERYGPGAQPEIDQLKARLREMIARESLPGYLLDLDELPPATHRAVFRTLNAQADQHYECVYAKNLVAQAIRDLINGFRVRYNLEYLVLVGNDDIIPFFRHPDTAGLASERNYVPPVSSVTTSDASLRHGRVLSQDDYGAQCGLSIHGSQFPVPDLAVGRLVETPRQMLDCVEAYLALPGGELAVPTSSLVTGYDFLNDAAREIGAELKAGIGGLESAHDALIAVSTVPNDPLVDWETNPDGWLAPEDPRSWTAELLRDLLLERRHDILFLAGHYNAGAALAADWKTHLLAETIAASPADLRNAIVIGTGCHVGYNVVDQHHQLYEVDVGGQKLTVNSSPAPDWAQTFAGKQVAAFIGGTGYQYGDTDFMEYHERLYLEFVRQLRRGEPGVGVPIGKALVRAKRSYLGGTPEPRALHEKTMLEVVLYGLPMVKVNLPIRSNPAIEGSIIDGLSEYPQTDNPGGVLGLRYSHQDLATGADLRINPMQLRVYTQQPDGTIVWDDREASYLTGPQGQFAPPCEPILPLARYNVTCPDTMLRGVVWLGGDYEDEVNVRPVTGAPSDETGIRGVHVSFRTDVFHPTQPWAVNYFDAMCGSESERVWLHLFPAQYRSSAPESETGTRRRFIRMSLRLYYSAETQEYFAEEDANHEHPNRPGMSAAPSISGVACEVDGSTLRFRAAVVGNPAAGIQEVWVTYTSRSGAWYGRWESIQLQQAEATSESYDSSVWSGTLDLPEGLDPSDVRYFVQAVNGVGLATMDTQRGAYYTPGARDATRLGSSLEFLTLPASGKFGEPITLEASLRGTDPQDPLGTVHLADETVVFGIGEQKVAATTDASGIARVTDRLLGIPGAYNVQATFAGSASHAPASASGWITVEPQATRIVLRASTPAPNLNLQAVLTDVLGQPLGGRTVAFAMRSYGAVVHAAAVATDATGRALLGAVPPGPGDYVVEASFGGSDVSLPGSVADACYLPCSASLQVAYVSQHCIVEYEGDRAADVGETLHLSARVSASPGSAAPDLSLALVDYVLQDSTGAIAAATTGTVAADGRSWASVSELPAGTYQLRVQASGGSFTSPAATAAITIHNPALTVRITGPASGSIFPVNTPVTFTASFTDTGGGPHSASWIFDGMSSPALVTQAEDGTSGTITGIGTFTQPGVYLVSLRVDGLLGYELATLVNGVEEAMIVVYDPTAGFVTGGGWIDSPPGAYAPDPLLVGRANFGFVSKYKKGLSVPTGETEFQFHAARMKFNSTSYDWLVVAGARAQYAGTGKINGAGHYKFLLTAIDGDLQWRGAKDKLRIRIWDAATGLRVYDNQLDAPSASDPTTILGGGSIVIHK